MAHAANQDFCGNLSYVIQQDKMTWPNVTAKLKDKTGVTAATGQHGKQHLKLTSTYLFVQLNSIHYAFYPLC